MAFPKSRILTTKRFIQLFHETKDKQRFCFILGAGASVDSKIPAGNRLEMIWMNELMGRTEISLGHRITPEDTKKLAKNLYDEDELEHDFVQIEKAWELALQKAEKEWENPYSIEVLGPTLSSEYYFDLYKLRFHPNPRNGYRYLEEKMEGATPSLGYHTLALILSKDNRHNLVLTTNFDSLTEDALFLYTPKRPLVVGHESLAAYIDSDTNRPIIAKIHRGLMFDPFNSPETTDHLQEEWRKALDYAFTTYTPIVIGYGGGDSSLMAFLKESELNKGIYWCYMEDFGLPGKEIQKFVRQKNGCFVAIRGFDNLMRELGKDIFPNDIGPENAEKYLFSQSIERSKQYKERWNELNNNPNMTEISKPINNTTLNSLIKRPEEETFTYLSHFKRAHEASDKGDYNTAIHEYTLAIEKSPTHPTAYNNRGLCFAELAQHKQAIIDFDKAIELDPNDADAYCNRANSYVDLKQYEQAIHDYGKAIELDANKADAYNNRGLSYAKLKQYERAILDYNRAIELNPNDTNTYYNRGCGYYDLKQYERAIQDFDKAIELDVNKADAYNNRGTSYNSQGKYEQAIKDYTKAIELAPNDVMAYHNRGNSHRLSGRYEQAIQDCTKAIELDPNCADAYRKRSYAYRDLGKNDLAESDKAKAAELEAAEKTDNP